MTKSCCQDSVMEGGGRGLQQAWAFLSLHLPPHLTNTLTDLWHQTENFTTSARIQANGHLAAQEPLKVVIVTVFAVLLLQQLLTSLSAVVTSIQDHGLVGSFVKVAFRVLKSLPFVGAFIQKEKDKVVNKITEGFQHSSIDRLRAIPKAGKSHEEVLRLLHDIRDQDKEWQGRCSGTVYMGGEDYEPYTRVLTTAYGLFAHTNPLHPDVFPSGQRFEKEVVTMGASLFGGDEHVCGNVTTGGTESILMAVKTARDYARAVRGITQPELVMAESAHPAYDKGCHYFGIKLRRARVGSDFRADVSSIRRLVTTNTVMIVASAPGYPHGTIDDVEAIGRLALKRGICLHVDCCLGGFVLPFARELGYPIPPFDFSVPGVTSISADLHKYGLAPKGNSLILYKNRELRRHQFLAVTDWTGGLYVSPTATGSRAGGLQAAAWAALLLNGREGYLRVTKRIMEAAKAIRKGIDSIDGLYVMGEPAMTVVAFGAREIDVYKVNDVMTANGWSLNALQRPPSVHICVTLQHVDVVDSFLRDLAAAVETVRSSPDKLDKGMAPIYGAAGKMPDRGTVGELLVAYMDAAC